MAADTPDPRPDSLFPPLPEVPQEAYEERMRDWPDPRPVSPPSELTALHHAPRFRQDHEYEPRYPAAPAGLDVIYIVKFSNYWPAEIDSIFLRQEDAEARAAELGGAWEAVRWRLRAASQPSEDGPAE